MSIRRFVLAFSIAVAAAAVARGADDWSLTTADLKTESVKPRAIDDTNATFVGATGDRVVPLASLVQISRPSRSKPISGLVLCIDGGQRLVGVPKKLDGSNLTWSAGGLGDVTVPVESVLAVLRDRTTVDGLADARTEDQARLTSGDTVRGILTDVAADAFAFTPVAGGDAVKVAPSAVAAILFATPPGGRKPVAPPAYLVRIAGGNVIAADSLALKDNRVTLHRAAGNQTVGWSEVESIDHTGGPVAWLSARTPIESVYTPYLDGRLPARMDTTVTGGPIRVGGITFAHGIGVHSRSKLVFSVQPGDKSFRTRYAIDSGQNRADVDVRVSVDGKIVHEQKGFKAGAMSPIVTAELAGAKTLTLEVDYGQGYDVQDRVNWIEPAIVRSTQ